MAARGLGVVSPNLASVLPKEPESHRTLEVSQSNIGRHVTLSGDYAPVAVREGISFTTSQNDVTET